MGSSFTKKYDGLPTHTSSDVPSWKSRSTWINLLLLATVLYTSHSITWSLIKSYNPWKDPGLPPYFPRPPAHCAHIRPIAASSYHDRQQRLAEILHSLGAAAYIAEPGANAAYFANVSSSHWHISERPLLLIVQPQRDDNGQIHANVSILTPSFEATRAKLLPIPSASNITWPEWREEVDPYDVAISSLSSKEYGGTIFVDGYMRNFVVDGLRNAAAHVKVASAPVEIRRLRERKSKEEIDILKCANEATVLGIRAARQQMTIGMRESQAQALVVNALSANGLSNPGALTLFGENAALPHGSGTDKILKQSDFILVDAGGSLHGYTSDVTRTFALSQSRISQKNMYIFDVVKLAQLMAMGIAHNGTITEEVDDSARRMIALRGFEKYFTHRLGHGIGLEGHESPYLRGGSDDVILTGHTFSNEPGIYIEGEVGVRLEDCFYINEDGFAEYLTAGVGGASTSPYDL